jgi:hypothetical protein
MRSGCHLSRPCQALFHDVSEVVRNCDGGYIDPVKLLLAIMLRPAGTKHTQQCFTLRLSIERTMDSSNLIGGEQKFVHWAFKREASKQWPLKRQHGSTFWEFLHQEFVW